MVLEIMLILYAMLHMSMMVNSGELCASLVCNLLEILCWFWLWTV